MQNLIKLKKNEVFTDSSVVAKGTDNEHESIVRILSNYKDDFEYFGNIEFTDLKSGKRGRPTRIYSLNEEQATLLLTYLDNNEVVRAFKKELVKQFYEVKKLLLERQSLEWQETRKQGKLIRKNETDIIKELVEYAKEQGSRHSDMLYMIYSKLANKMSGIEDRNSASTIQLNILLTAENIIYKAVVEGMNNGLHYKDIYKDSKSKLELFRSIAYIETPLNTKRVEVR